MAGPATPSAAFKMISIPEALQVVLSEAQPLPADEVPFAAAFRRTLAKDVCAAEPVPGYRASIKDGYAVVSSDGPGEYGVAFEALRLGDVAALQAAYRLLQHVGG